MNVWRPEDWDGEIAEETRDRLRAMREADRSEPVVVMVSPAFEGGRALLADLEGWRVEAGDLMAPSVVAGARLSGLLDHHIGAGVGRLVAGVRLTDPEAVRGILVLPETIEIYSIPREPAQRPAGPVCILDLAGLRVHVSDDGGVTWHSSNLTP